MHIEDINAITYAVIGCVYKVYRHLGPGLLESIYEQCLMQEIRKNGHRVERQVAMPVVYDDITLEVGYRIDLFVDDEVVLEIKSVDAIHPVHEAQLLTYLKLSGKRVGLLLNFNVDDMSKGITRRIL
ncbi:MAG: GxxExxY protein [Ignavibacteria bacterium]|nr:MAG: GxxExxY protein [Ignavibacteria bacterium]